MYERNVSYHPEAENVNKPSCIWTEGWRQSGPGGKICLHEFSALNPDEVGRLLEGSIVFLHQDGHNIVSSVAF